MAGVLNCGGFEVINSAAYRTTNNTLIVGNMSSASASVDCIVLGPTLAIDDSSTSSLIAGYNGSIQGSPNSVNLGISCLNLNSNSTIIVGQGSTASNSNGTVVIGSGATSGNASSSVAIGEGADIGGNNSVALGGNARTNNVNSIAIGKNSVSNGANAIALGSDSQANGYAAIILGSGSSSSFANAHCLGNGIINNDPDSLLIGATDNIRPSAGTCELGTVSKPFRNLWLSGFALSNSASNRIPSVRCTLSDTTAGFSATTVETSIIQGTLSGSLAIPPGTFSGFTARMIGYWLYSSGAATTFTIRLNVNGTTALTVVIPVGAVVNQVIHAEHMIQCRAPNNRIFLGCQLLRNGANPIMSSTTVDSLWNPIAVNTISMTGQFSDTNGAWRGDLFELSSSYAS